MNNGALHGDDIHNRAQSGSKSAWAVIKDIWNLLSPGRPRHRQREICAPKLDCFSAVQSIYGRERGKRK